MGPLYELNSACVIATSVGTSADIMGSQRVIEHLERWFGFGLTVPTNGGEWLRENSTHGPDGQRRPREGNDRITRCILHVNWSAERGI